MTAGAPPDPHTWDWRLRDDNPNEWAWGNRARRRHDLARWLPVQVPVGVQTALLHARRIRHPYRDLHSREAEWVEHRDWVYAADFELAPPPAGRRLFLDFESVDDRCRVYLNGTLLIEHEGPAAPFSVEIGPHLQAGGNQVIIVIQAPWPEDSQVGWTEHTHSLKGRGGYGWDFGPRLVPIGILGAVRLRATGPHRLDDLWVRPATSPPFDRAAIRLQVAVDGPPGATVEFTVRHGRRMIATATAPTVEGHAATTVTVAPPALWWPNGLGAQPLYTAEARIVAGSDRRTTGFGIRQVRWLGRPDGPPEEWPFTLEINGRRVFQQGWNWVAADSLPDRATPRRSARLLDLARAAGANILRLNGVYDPETDAFYDACDRRGLLLWQELPLSSSGISNVPPGDAAYIERAATYAAAVVAARRNHPSLVLWDGGNELTEPTGPPLTLAHPYAARMAQVVAATDPDRAFRPSSPLGPTFEADPAQPLLWDVHGSWDYSERWPGPQYWRLNGIRPLLHSEVGLPGEASLATQQRWLTPPHRDRAPDSPARRHHGGAWWEHAATVDRVFGPIADAALAVLASQWLQAEGLRYYVAETRRRWPHTAGILLWQLNEPWPNVVCTSVIEYGGRPKLAYYAVQAAFRPSVISAHYPELKIAPGTPLRVGVWALNAGPACTAELAVDLADLDGRPLHAPLRRPVALPAEAGTGLGDVLLDLPADFSGVLVLDLALGPQHNRYLFSNRVDAPLQDALRRPDLLREMFAPGPLAVAQEGGGA